MLSQGRQGQLYVIEESTFGTVPAIAASNAMRHINFTTSYDPKGRVPILEKKQGAGHSTSNRGDRRAQASWNYEGLFRAAGTISTLTEQAPILLAGFGSVKNTSLSTTFSGTPTVSTGTIASATGLAVGDFVAITCPDGKVRLRRVTTAATSLVWAPNLPAGQAPASGAALKAVVNYKLTSSLTKSLAFSHYLKKTDGTAGLARAVRGSAVEKLMFDFDANAEPMIKASGPAKDHGTAAAQPGGFTTLGLFPPSGISGEMLINNTAIKFLKFGAEITNAMFMRNEEYGDVSAVETFRGGRRSVDLMVDTYLEDQTTLYDLTSAGTYVSVFFQGGYTEGNMFALYSPYVEFKVPDVDDPDTAVKAPYKGSALEALDQNDEITLAIA